ncbi:MAG: thioredoxin family protein [Myxococcota bacterium]|nr:thioredoxin family protein [Myxococcota bacterium]
MPAVRPGKQKLDFMLPFIVFAILVGLAVGVFFLREMVGSEQVGPMSCIQKTGQRFDAIAFLTEVRQAKHRHQIAANRPVVLQFTADYCLPCHMMTPWLEALCACYNKFVDIVEIDLDDPRNEPLALAFNIDTLPTQIYFSKGRVEMYRHLGLAPQQSIAQVLRKYHLLPPQTGSCSMEVLRETGVTPHE